MNPHDEISSYLSGAFPGKLRETKAAVAEELRLRALADNTPNAFKGEMGRLYQCASRGNRNEAIAKAQLEVFVAEQKRKGAGKGKAEIRELVAKYRRTGDVFTIIEAKEAAEALAATSERAAALREVFEALVEKPAQ